MIVAIDGPAGAGKSTVARALADRLGMGYLDTGAMYRALTWLALERGVDPGDGPGLASMGEADPVRLTPTPQGLRVEIAGRDVTRDIRDPAVTARVSEVASHREVRRGMVALQRGAMAGGDWVIDGRDAGSVVCPDAEVKVFLTASASERARRRHRDLADRGTPAPLGDVQADVERRDRLDSTRAESPLVVAPGATVLDTSDMDVAGVVDALAAMVAGVRR